MKRKTPPPRPERRTFWFSLAVALFVFITAAGLITVDYQGRKLSFGDTAPPFALDRQGTPTLHVKTMGVDTTLDATGLERLLDFFCDFACLPHR